MTGTEPANVQRLEFFFDLMCPWAYQTSLWIREVREQRGLDIEWRFFSLETVNREEGKKFPWEREWSYGWSQLRIAALLRRRGQDEVDRWYEVMGRAFHEDAVPTHVPDQHRQLLAEHGWDPGLVDEAIADPSTTEEVRADHDHAVEQLGGFGVPILVHPDGSTLYGPVVAPAPVGEEAGRLWDLVQEMRTFDGLYELKVPKTGDDLARIGTIFAPYLKAREWRTIENPAP